MDDKRQKRIEDARDRLKKRHGQGRIMFTPADYVSTKCPNCGSGMVRVRKSEVISQTTRQRRHICLRCPAQWNSLETIPVIDQEPFTPPEDNEN